MNVKRNEDGTVSMTWDMRDKIELHLKDGTVRLSYLWPMVFVDDKLVAVCKEADDESGDVTQVFTNDAKVLNMEGAILEKVTKGANVLIVLAED